MDLEQEVNTFLSHHGVKGMHWGIRKQTNYAGADRATNRAAKKDAEEFARAKLFFGQGAGTRRKLVNASINAKKAKDPLYAAAFEHHLSRQDLSAHASGARKERSHIDRKDRTKKRAGFIARRVTGEMGTQAAFMAVALGGAAFLNSPKGRAITQQVVSKAKNSVDDARRKQGATYISDWLKTHGG